MFAITYENDYTLIGTTDRDYHGDLQDVHISDEETDYLCAAASEYFAEPVRRDDIVWTYSAVRPLHDDGASRAQEATRDYVLAADAPAGQAVLINVFGGKITTYRRLAEQVLERIEGVLGKRGNAWTCTAKLPGGNFAHDGYDALVERLRRAYPFLEAAHAARLVRLYGTHALDIPGPAKAAADLGRCFGADLYEAEIRWLVTKEWARTAQDVLWRRTKRGLVLTEEEAAALDRFMEDVARFNSAAAE